VHMSINIKEIWDGDQKEKMFELRTLSVNYLSVIKQIEIEEIVE